MSALHRANFIINAFNFSIRNKVSPSVNNRGTQTTKCLGKGDKQGDEFMQASQVNYINSQKFYFSEVFIDRLLGPISVGTMR